MGLDEVEQAPQWWNDAWPTGVPGKLTTAMREQPSLWLLKGKKKDDDPYPWESVCVFARIQNGKPLNDVDEEIEVVQTVYEYCQDVRDFTEMQAYDSCVLSFKERLKGK